MIIKILIIFVILVGGTILIFSEELNLVSQNSLNSEEIPKGIQYLQDDLKNIENKLRDILPKNTEK
ncbi:MAG: hypothetical protein NPMRd3_60003 [Nitrosopumilales archaeon]|nr:MAG: hypothetical protein NPMRd3_60003 [Nitrosopumilales archaeon]HEU04603.1 hypothetical protein [Nitrosopumilus sp.]